MLKHLLQIVYPSFCPSCQQLLPTSEILCSSCYSHVKQVTSLILPVTKKYSLTVMAASAYQDPLKKMITRKFAEDILASKQLAYVMLETIPSFHFEADYIVPIPLHWTRYAKRGFNQALEMARVLKKETGVPILNILARKKRTKFQSQLSKQEKKENVENAFCIHWKYKILGTDFLKNKKILIIDDLCTTGQTLTSAARALTKLKPESVGAVVACRTL